MKKSSKDEESANPAPPRTVGLKQLAAHLGLNPATVSVVLNDVPGRSIPPATRARIKAAAKEMNYQPNLLARSLRDRRTHTIGVLLPQLGDGYHTQVMCGIGDELMGAGYFYFTAHHRHHQNLVHEYTRMLIGRGAQGIIAIDTLLDQPISVPVVAVAGHRQVEGVTNVSLDHIRAAELILTHLYSLGHRNIAFMQGQSFSSDSNERWTALVQVAKDLGIQMNPELLLTLNVDSSSPEIGYPVVQKLLDTGQPFTALVAFNDISAIGCIRALRDRNLRVPGDVSVIGFDNINAAAYTLPSLTTISQSMEEIGKVSARSLLDRLGDPGPPKDQITVEPRLVIRESTGPVRN